MSSSKSKDTLPEDRPWPVGSVMISRDSDDDLDLVVIVGYLHESDCVADTEVVYYVPAMQLWFAESVEFMQQFFREPSIEKAVVVR